MSEQRKKQRINARPPPKRALKPKQPSNWHLNKGDLPDGSAKTKTAFELHIRILWLMLTQFDVPPTVTAADRQCYNARYSSEPQIKTSVTSRINKYMDIINDAPEQVQALRDSIPQSTSIIANN
ncbi:hypothetical protein DXG01_012093, partial [Tephrocybe rancida]